MFDDCLIMAGGSGTRLWPASSSRLPKQFLPADGARSFFSLAVERALTVTKPGGRIIVIAGKAHIPHVVKGVAKFPAAVKRRLLVVAEPAAKNTAPAVACALRLSCLAGGGRTMLVLTSDHIISPAETFAADAAVAAAVCSRGKLAVFGIAPARAETGYGYIEAGAKEIAPGVTAVKAFREKPDAATAKRYVAGGRHFWNSGMFAFSSDFMAETFARLAPEVASPFARLKALPADGVTLTGGVKVAVKWPGLAAAYRKAAGISFDYAVAEKCADTAMVRANFGWTDIGNWEEYVALRPAGTAAVFSAASTGCSVDSDIPVALAGVDDLIVVIRSGGDGSPAAALVTRKGMAHTVRDVVERIKAARRGDLL